MPDLRTVYWHEIASQDWLSDLRLRCYEHLLRIDATPDEVARALGASILAIRPRCSELRTGIPADARNPLVLAETTGERRGHAHVLRGIPYAVALERWRQRERGTPVQETPRGGAGYPSVEAALSDLPPEKQAALGAALLGKWGHLLKKRQPPAGQLELISA